MWLCGAGWTKSSDVALWRWVDEELCLFSAIVRKIIFGDGFNAENRAKIKWDFFFLLLNGTFHRDD